MPSSEAKPTTQQSDFHSGEKEIVQEETVQFIEDGSVKVNDQLITINADYLKTGEDNLVNSVVDFMKRPVVVNEFTWNGSQNPLTELFVPLVFPSTLLSRVMQQQKIAGFRYFRADLVVRLQVNAQPFNAGRMILWWEPFGNSQSVIPSNVRHLGGITGYRHIDLDVADSTAVELKIPYMSPLSYTDLVTGFGEMGKLHACVYSKLSGGDDVEGTVWAHFENVKLEMPTGVPLHAYTGIPARLQAQGATDKTIGGKDSVLPDKKKEKQKAKGDWQNLFDAQSKAAKNLKGIPVIGEVATAIEWFADAASWISGMFGWSRPTNPVFETPISIRYLRNFANFNGNTLSKPLALDARNEIMIPHGFVDTTDDEMCFAHILSQPVYIDRFSYATSEVPGTLLWAWPVHPASCLTTFTDGVATRFNTYLSYVADCFKLWRGGINYHFKAVKTPFHSGRLRFIYVPGATPSTNVSNIDFDKCFTQIVDLRDNIEFDFTIPFVSNKLWEAVKTKPLYVDGDRNLGIPTGMIYAQVLNTLKAAGQADPQIEILVETSVADDFQFAELYLDGAVKVLEDFPGAIPVRTTVSDVVRLKAEIAFFPSTDLPGYEPNLASTGEVVTSFRQCLKRYMQLVDAQTPTVPADQFMTLFPYSTSSNDANVNDLYSYVSHIFRTFSGSLRVLLTPSVLSNDGHHNFKLAYADPAYSGLNYVNATIGTFSLTTSQPIGKFFDSEELIEFDVPWYQPMPILPTGVGKIPSRSFSSLDPSKIPSNMGSRLEYKESQYIVNRCIGEDFNFSYLLGVPISTYTNPTT